MRLNSEFSLDVSVKLFKWSVCNILKIKVEDIYNVFCIVPSIQGFVIIYLLILCADLCCVVVQHPFSCSGMVSTSMQDQEWVDSYNYLSLSATMHAYAMLSSWYLVPSVSEFRCYLLAIFTSMLKESELPVSSKKQHLLHYIKDELFPLESEVYTQQRHLCLNCILYWKSLGEEMSRMIENRLL
jgi:hypothetical protein